eukprot:jgi/Botrbrau1/20961/Bobra.0135s0079.1
MSLKAVLTGVQLRHFRSGLQCLAKLGSELLLEALPGQIILRTINSSKSAYAAVTYYAAFFNNYDLFGTSVVQAGILMKQALAIFRTQKVAKLEISIAQDAARLTATVFSENGLVKEYTIPCMESEILQAAVDRASLPTCVVAAARELNKLLSSFQSNLEEITIIAMPESDRASKPVQLHSFLDPAKAGTERSLQTQLCIDTMEVFLSYQHASSTPSDVTFNLKDLRCMLALCEAMQADVTIRFDRPGQPLLVEPVFRGAALQEVDYAAELVLATLVESQAGRLAERAAPPASTVVRRRAPPSAEGRSPHVPGDTPWGPPPDRTGAAGPSRFAPRTGPAQTTTPLTRQGPDSDIRRLPVHGEGEAPAQPAPAGGSEGGPPASRGPAQSLAAQFADAWTDQRAGASQEAPRSLEGDVEVEVEVEGDMPHTSGRHDDPLLDAKMRHRLEAEDRGGEEQGEQEWRGEWVPQQGAGARHWADAGAQEEGQRDGEERVWQDWALPLHSRYLEPARQGALDAEDEEEEEDAIPGTPPGL